jgi:M6 family metalloprotease-like protein
MKKIFVFGLIMAGIMFYMSGICYGAPAAPVIHELIQPDGTVIYARQWGDEWSRGWETTEGYSIAFDKNTGYWTYATLDNEGRLSPSTRIVGRHLPLPDIKKRLRPIGKAHTRFLQIKATQLKPRPERVVPSTGTANIPIILINFSDTTTTYTASDFDTLLFGIGNKSMKDYYEEVSYGVFSVSAGSSGIAGWYTASNTHDYYGQNDSWGYDKWPGTLVREAVAAADATFDFAPYDQDGDCYVDVVSIIHQGSGEEASGISTDIWSHRWDLNSAYYWGYSDGGEYTTNDPCPDGGYIKVNDYVIQPETLWGGIQTIGAFTHEYAHALGLPDLYDTDYSSEGIGAWSLMAAGSWNYTTTPGDTPAHLDAWSKYYLGWVTPTQVIGTLANESIEQAATAADVYQLLPGSPSTGGEYFLVENRQRTGFDTGLPGDGLLIWHIDEAQTNNDNECYPGGPSCATNHYHVALVQADGLWELEKGINSGDAGDPFPGTTGNTSFTDTTNPNSNLYDGTLSNVSVTDISTSGSIMIATLSVGGPPSCPSLYFWNGNDYERRGFIFPGAIPRENEYRDHIPLPYLTLKDGMYYLQIRETEPEKSFIDMTKLIIVDHSSDVDIRDFFLNRKSKSAPHTRTYEMWYNSNVALEILKQNTYITVLSPISAEHSVIGDVRDQLQFSDDIYVRMLTGDIITLIFPFIPLRDEVRDFIFVGEGFYVPLKKP